ncbi:MAG: alpha/beta hydrolase [Actinobacteria bacterium]|nr:alpha/beta hydrolase [Actinomycetota bacterium]
MLIVHGYDSHPDAHWFGWLRSSLGEAGVEATVVPLPSPHDPVADEWCAAIAQALGTPDAATWVVAHSLGCISAMRALAALPEPWELGGLVLVAGFTGRLDSIPALDEYLAEDVDTAGVRAHARTRVVVRSDDDPYVPAASTEALADRLGAELHVVPGAGHFMAEDGVSSLALVRDTVLRDTPSRP